MINQDKTDKSSKRMIENRPSEFAVGSPLPTWVNAFLQSGGAQREGEWRERRMGMDTQWRVARQGGQGDLSLVGAWSDPDPPLGL